MEENTQEDWKSKYMYLLADFENYRNRVARERTETINSANRELIIDFLSIFDDMERYEMQLPETEDLEANISPVISGFKIIKENMIKLLEAEGCFRIDVKLGEDFDPMKHEALGTRKLKSMNPGKISDIVSSGWVLNGKLLRPVRVIVSK